MPQEQLSELIQQTLSPVHAALNIPQAPPPYVQAAAYNTPFFGGGPSPQSPYYNPQYNMAPAIINSARSRIVNYALRDDAMITSPTHWSMDQGTFRMAADPLGRRVAAAENLAARQASKAPGIMSGLLGTAAFGASFMIPGGFLGQMIGGTALSMGADALGGVLDNTLFSKARDLRQGGMMMRGRLMPGLLGTQFGQDHTGVMRHDVAQELTNRIQGLSNQDSRFTGKEFMQMTDKMAQLGMFRDVGSPEQLVNRVKDVSKQLKVFAKIANEPDIIEALKQLSQLRNLGISDSQLNQSASNARAFARMAGLSKDQMMASGMAGAQVFQQMGMSGAAGYQVGMLNRGLVTANQGMFSRGMLAQYGGAAGLSNLATAGIAATQQHQTGDMLMHALFRSKGGGQFSLDNNVLNRVLSGGMSLTDAFNKRLGQLQQNGDVVQHMQDFQERLPELREALQQRLGGAGMQLMAIRQAQALQQASGGKMTMYTALHNLTGNESQARVLARLATSPQATQQLITQTKYENRRRALAERQEIEYDASLGAALTRGWRRMTSNFLGNRSLASYLSRRDQEVHDRAAGVYGANTNDDQYLQMSKQQRDEALSMLARGQVGGAKFGLSAISDTHGMASWKMPMTALSDRILGGGTLDRIATEFTGDDYVGGKFFRGMRQAFTNPAAQLIMAPATAGASLIAGGLSLAFGSNRDRMDQRELARRALASARVGRRIFDGSEKSMTDTALGDLSERRKFAAATGIDSSMINRAMVGAMSDTRSRLKSLRGIFSHGKWDVTESQQNLIDALKKQGLSGDQLEKARKYIMSDKEGGGLMAGMMRTLYASSGDSDRSKIRAQVADHMKLEGQVFGDMQKELQSQVEGAFGRKQYLFGEGSAYFTDNISSDAAGEFVGMVGKTGAKTPEDMQSMLKYLRVMSRQQTGDLAGTDVASEIGKLFEGKSESEIKRLQSIFKSAGSRFSGLKNKGELAKHLGDSSVDLKKLGDVLGRNTKQIHAIALERSARQALEDKFGITGLGDNETAAAALSKRFRDDKSFRQDLAKKNSGMYDVLQREQMATDDDSREKARKSIYEYALGGRSAGKTGVTAVDTGGSSPAARAQLQAAQQLHDVATNNARNTQEFGTMVDRMASLVGKTGDGVSLGAAVTTFQRSVDKFALTLRQKSSG